MSEAANQGARVCSVVHSRYPMDSRVRRAAEALRDADMEVEVVCLRGEGELARETVDGVRVLRLPCRHSRKSLVRTLWSYFVFFVLALATISRRQLRRRYSLVHVHNMPDFLVFTAILPRLLGARVILDLHDPMPEVFMAKFEGRRNHPIMPFLRLQERVCIRFAHAVVTPNEAFRKVFVARGCPNSKITIVMNSPQEEIFFERPDPRARVGEPFVLMYHGTMVERYGIHKALAAIQANLGELEPLAFEVFGGGEFEGRCRELITELELTQVVRYHGEVAHDEIAEALSAIDLGVIPNEHSLQWDLAIPTRIFEYLAMRKPVVAPRTRGILDYFGDDHVFFFESGNEEDLARALLEARHDTEGRRRRAEAGYEVYLRHRWGTESQRFTELACRLVGKTPDAGRLGRGDFVPSEGPTEGSSS